MNEVIRELTEMKLILKEILLKDKKKESFILTDKDTTKEFSNTDELVEFIEKNYNYILEENQIKNLTKLHTVKTKSKFKKIFGDEFKLERI